MTSIESEVLTAPAGAGEPDADPEDTALRHRLLGYRPTDRFWGWAVPILIAGIGGILRFWRLDQPHQLVFDETYYVKQAASYLRAGYELATDGESTPKPDEKFIHGTVDVFLNSPDFVVHPPVGKWMIALGEWVFGPASSWGWRFSAAAVGTLSILMIGRIARRLFGSTLLGGVAALLLAVDGEHFVLSRTGLLDVFVMFWAVVGFGCLLIDRDRARARLADRIGARTARSVAARSADAPVPDAPVPDAQLADAQLALPDPPGSTREIISDAVPITEPARSDHADHATHGDHAAHADHAAHGDHAAQAPARADGGAEGFGPWLGVRWWRIAGVVSLALCAGTKWSGAFFLVAFLTASALWDFSARRAARLPRWFLGTALRDGLQAVVTTLILAPVTYVATWAGWFLSTDAYYRQWARDHPSTTWGWVPASLRSLWRYHQDMYHFNITLHSPHVYQSNPWSWSVLGRPTAFYYESYKQGVNGCPVAECSRAITDLGNPVIWWGGTVSIAVLLFAWLLGRDWRAGAVLAGLVGGYLPWFHYQARTIYTFYAVAFAPWIVLGLTFALGLLIGPRTATPSRRVYGTILAGTLVVLAVLAFAFFYPVLSAQVIPRSDWSARMWLPSWI